MAVDNVLKRKKNRKRERRNNEELLCLTPKGEAGHPPLGGEGDRATTDTQQLFTTTINVYYNKRLLPYTSSLVYSVCH